MKRLLIALVSCLLAVLVLPGGSLATISEVGDVPSSATPTVPNLTPSCPSSPCLALSRTTGYQAKVGTVKAPFVIPANGRIVAWTIDLGNPNAKQISFFNANEGGAASAGISVLFPGKKLNYTLVAQSPYVQLQPYFGEVVQFPLTNTLSVKKGDVVGLTVPTWAPALALGYANDTSWRASRPKGGCTNTTNQTAHTSLKSTVQYFCLYRTARLTYSVTLISNPVPTKSNPNPTTTTTTTSTTSTGTSTTTSKTSTSTTKTSTTTTK